MRERDRCGPNFHYDVVMQADLTNSTFTVAPGAQLDHAQLSWKKIGVVTNASSMSVDVALSNLSSLIDGQTQQLSVRAVNSEGPATGHLQSVTVTSHPSTFVYCALYTGKQTAAEENDS